MAGIKNMVSKLSKGSNPFDNGLQKLTIAGYLNSDFSKKIAKEFQVQFNPTEFKEAFEVEYLESQPVGSSSGEQRFKYLKSKEYTLKFILDATGVSGENGNTGKKGIMGLTADTLDIKKELDLFESVACQFKGSSHEVPYVKIKWGSQNTFSGRLKSYTVTHKLFKADGTSLRCEVEAVFKTAEGLKEQQLKEKKESPDLTHVRTVKLGDTLPLMCKDIYNDSSHYLKVAKFNNLMDFRNLEPGTEIIFPPIV